MKKALGVLVILSFWLIACNSPEPPPEAQGSPSPTVEVEPSATPNPPSPTVTLSPSPTNLPTETPTFTPSPSPTLATIDLQNAIDLHVIRSVPLSEYITSSWSPNGNYFAYADDNVVTILETGTLGVVYEREIKNELDAPEEINALAFLDEQTLLLTVERAGQGVQVIHFADNTAEVWPFTANQEGIYRDVEVSPDGKTLVLVRYSASFPAPGTFALMSIAEVWDIGTQTKTKPLVQANLFIPDMEFSPDGKWLGMIGSGFTLFDATTFEEVLSYEPSEEISSMSFHPDGMRMFLVYEQWIISIDTVSSETKTFASTGGNPQSGTFSPTGSLFVAANEEGNLKFFDLISGEQVSWEPAKTFSFEDVSFHKEGKILAVVGSREILFLSTGQPLPTSTPRPPTNTPPASETPTPLLPTFTGTPVPIAEVLQNGDLPVITSQNADKLQHVANFVVAQDIQDVFWSPDGTKLIVVHPVEGVDVYSFAAQQGILQKTQIIPTWDTDSFAVSPDGAQIAKRNIQGQFEIFDTQTGEQITVVGGPVENDLGAFIAWGPHMDILATMYNIPLAWTNNAPQIRLYDLNSGDLKGVYGDFNVLQTSGLTFSPGGTLLATTSLLDNFTYVWSLKSGKLAYSLYGTQPVFSPNGQMLAARNTDTIVVYSTADLSQLAFCEAPLWETADYSNSIFSPDSTLLVTTGNALRFWSLPDGTSAAEFETQEPYTHAAFSPDGKLLVTVRGEGASTRIMIWAVLP